MAITTRYAMTDMGVIVTNGGSLPEAIGIVDLDNDGQSEIFYGVTGSISSPISPQDPYPFILKIGNDGTVRDIFADIVVGTLPKLGWGNDVVSGDFNGDGFNDLLIIDHGRENLVNGSFVGGRNILLLSDGNGRLTDASGQIEQTTSFWHSAINAADVDSDGDLDVVIANLSGAQNRNQSASLFLNDGNGNFRDATADTLPNNIASLSYDENDFSPGTAGFIDISSDGLPDVLLLPYMSIEYTPNNTKAAVLRNDGSGGFNSTSQMLDVLRAVDSTIPSSSGFSHFVVDDFNGDGLDDAIAIAEDPFSSGNHVHLTAFYQNESFLLEDKTLSTLGAYRFTVPSYDPETIGTNLASAKLISFDIDLDGDKDLLWPITNARSGNDLNQALFINDGNGFFNRDFSYLNLWTSKIQLQHEWSSLRPIFGDINNDGVLDLVVEDVHWVDYPSSMHSYFHVVLGEHSIEQTDTNTFLASFAKDIITGTAQKETVIFKGLRSGYEISINESSTTVTRISNRVDSDILTNIERLYFEDKGLALDIAGINGAGAAYRLYQAAFDRVPDHAGLGYWINAVDTGISLADIANSFIQSAEFQSMYGTNPSNVEFITLLYNNVLGRSPDQSGFDYWIRDLENGLSRAGALSSFSESSENQANVIGQIQGGFEYDLWLN